MEADVKDDESKGSDSVLSTDLCCEPCLEINRPTEAAFYCTECDENLCYACLKTHKTAKATKLHNPISINEKAHVPVKAELVSETSSALCEPHQSSVQFCDICVNESSVATNYCGNCKELLCQKCAALHTKQNATRGHTLSPVSEKQENPCILCDHCLYSGESNKSVRYCKLCSEFLCEICSDRHQRQKATKEHELCDANENFKTLPKCQICLNNEKKNVGSNYCKICDEFLCEICAELHNKQKATRNHRLTSTKAPIQIKGEHPLETCDEEYSPEIPGKPYASAADITADSVILSWKPSALFNDGDYYQVSFRDVDNKGKWTFWSEKCTNASAVITGLTSETKFEFRVRVVYEDGEGPYSEVSDEYSTITSLSSRLVKYAKIVREGDPAIYALPMIEKHGARNEKAKIRQLYIGSSYSTAMSVKERTIMLVGATGSGKSTLVDGLVNYVLGVSWNDPFMFTTNETEIPVEGQTLSNGDRITCFTINPEHGSRLSYRLNLIDIPGFGNSTGLQHDQEIFEQMRQFISGAGPEEISYIDAFCFIVRASDVRLTPLQINIFQSIMSLFGKDMECNICSLITFAEGIDPPVLASLRECKLPFGKHFTFNNAGLFAKKSKSTGSTLSQMFFDIRMQSFKEFFNHLDTIQAQSLQLTKDVLAERFRLLSAIKHLQPKIDIGLSKFDQLKIQIKILDDYKTQVEENKNFTYEITRTESRKKVLPNGLPEFEYFEVKVMKTNTEKQNKYQESSIKLCLQEPIVIRLGAELDEICEEINETMKVVKSCNDILNEISLQSDPLSNTEHIDQMIEAEQLEKKPSFMNRINVLNEFRKRARVMMDAETFSKDARNALGFVKQTGKIKFKSTG